MIRIITAEADHAIIRSYWSTSRYRAQGLVVRESTARMAGAPTRQPRTSTRPRAITLPPVRALCHCYRLRPAAVMYPPRRPFGPAAGRVVSLIISPCDKSLRTKLPDPLHKRPRFAAGIGSLIQAVISAPAWYKTCDSLQAILSRVHYGSTSSWPTKPFPSTSVSSSR